MCEAPVTTPFLHKSISVYGWLILIERNQVFPLSAELLGSRSAWLGAGNVGCVCLIMCRRENTCRGSAYSKKSMLLSICCARDVIIYSLSQKRERGRTHVKSVVSSPLTRSRPVIERNGVFFSLFSLLLLLLPFSCSLLFSRFPRLFRLI